ncbi:glycosyltransferase family 2 protein [Palleronia abyssalis]|uniref:Glycosyltransferase EpsE n=1 Tax=Palleronia abyssalis TaxID=1501240 RepID=A0A2R8BZD0_9RHOB|nr:glycosyltransferase family 2 protein [Palleronia abyssalis]SPJ25527.1 Putative glycosyltransferase EpsE [Palleronia abyssalis]
MTKVSVIMANYQGEAYIEAAIASVMRQTHADLELLITDDASPDGSVAVIRAWTARDERVVLLENETNVGVSAARNRALDQASGDWIAIMDSDDLIHPDRLRRLLVAARQAGVSMVADDMLFFSEFPDGAGRTLLQSLGLKSPHRIGAADLIASEDPAQNQPPFGYLKMLIARDALNGLRYDETLEIAEDFDFYTRLMLQRGDCLLLPEPMYLYRRHSASLSYRLSTRALGRMLAAQERMVAQQTVAADLADALRRRIGALSGALEYQGLVESLKARRKVDAIRRLLRRPRSVIDLFTSLSERLRRRRPAARSPLEIRIRAATGGPCEDVRLEQPPSPGLEWASPPASVAAKLSDLAAAHRLTVTAQGLAGLWWLWLVPSWSEARVELAAEEIGTQDLPLPAGAELIPQHR